MFKEKFQTRFDELDEKFQAMPNERKHTSLSVKKEYWANWATSSQNLILAVFGQNSPHYSSFLKVKDACTGWVSDVNAMHGVFSSAKEDFEGGYVFDVDKRISGEVFGDFVAMAKHSLSEGHKDVAAVLACAALEDTLKKYAMMEGLNVEDKSMTEVVNALKREGLVSGAQKSLLGTMPTIRNYALHANWDKITSPDVSSVIGFVEQFLLSKFSD